MTSLKTPDKPLDKVYAEASQWVRFANTVVWSMGALLVPVSFGFVAVALNKSGTQFSQVAKAILGVGSVFLFSFWVYASSFYKRSSDVARIVLKKIEEKWNLDEEDGMSFYTLQEKELIRRFKPFKWNRKLYSYEIRLGLFRLQMISLVVLVFVWVLIIVLEL